VTSEHFSVLGLARAGAPWFRDVGRWATAASLPVEFVRCLSVAEVQARLSSGRPFSALLVDGGLPGVDRDLVDLAHRGSCAVVAITDGTVRPDWVALGVDAVLPEPVERDRVLAVLREHARSLPRFEGPLTVLAPTAAPQGWRGRLVAVTGAGGTGTSTMAMAIAQGLAGDPRDAGQVLLADLALDADQAVLHGTGDVVPALSELVEAHRGGLPDAAEVRACTWELADRHYRLLLGLRRHRDWAALRPRALEATLDTLLRTFKIVVADVDPDLEGEDDCGSIDVEERNLLARATVQRADVVVVTAVAGVVGTHRLVRVLDGLLRFGVAPERLLPVVTRAPRRPRARAELAAAIPALLGSVPVPLASPLFVTERRRVEDLVRDAAPLPAQLTAAPATAVRALLDRLDEPSLAAPEPVRPGSLGAWGGSEP